jgi:hypothetical protein
MIRNYDISGSKYKFRITRPEAGNGSGMRGIRRLAGGFDEHWGSGVRMKNSVRKIRP